MATSARLDELKKKFDENPRRYFAPLANEYRKQGDLAQAVALCRTHLPNQPGHLSGHIVLAQTLYESRELVESRQIFEAALDLDPENLIALRYLGDIARGQGAVTAARTWYERVLEADPRNEEIAQLLNSLEGRVDQPPTQDDLANRPTPVSTPAYEMGAGDPDATYVVETRETAVPGEASSDESDESFGAGSPWETPSIATSETGASASYSSWDESQVDDPFAEPSAPDAARESRAPDSLAGLEASTEEGEAIDVVGTSSAGGDLAADPEPDLDDWFAEPTTPPVPASQASDIEESFFPKLEQSVPAEYAEPRIPLSVALEGLFLSDQASPDNESEPSRQDFPDRAESVAERPEAAEAASSGTGQGSVAPEGGQPQEDSALLPDEESVTAEMTTEFLELQQSELSDFVTAEYSGDLAPPEAATASFAAPFDLTIASTPIEEPADELVVETGPYDASASDVSESDYAPEMPRLASWESALSPEQLDHEHLASGSHDAIDGSGDAFERSGHAPISEPEDVFEASHEIEEPVLGDPTLGRIPDFDRPASPPPAPFVTETMAELYLQQGFHEEALGIYRQLLERNPDDRTLQDRVASLSGAESGPPVAESFVTADEPVDAPAPTRYPDEPNVRDFFARFANRVRGASPRGNGSDGAAQSSGGAGESWSSRIGGAASMSEALTVPDDGTTLADLFAAGSVAPADDRVATDLASAFTSSTTETAAASPGGELSLQSLFGDVPAHSAGAVTPSDSIFSSGSAPTEASSSARDGTARNDGDIEQFTAWLEGLKKK